MKAKASTTANSNNPAARPGETRRGFFLPCFSVCVGFVEDDMDRLQAAAGAASGFSLMGRHSTAAITANAMLTSHTIV